MDEMADIWNLRGAALERWRRIVRGSEIDFRHAVAPPRDVVHLSTQQRMQAYERLAPPLAAEAAAQAIERSGINPQRITDLIVVSCTGFSAPGVDAALIQRLGLRRNVRRLIIGFMGCFGGISGLRAAAAACAADPDAIALVVCIELCSLHMRASADIENQVASALFADGAAAAVVASAAAPANEQCLAPSGAVVPLGAITAARSLLLPDGADWMSWRITDAGFAMTLSRRVPGAIESSVRSFVAPEGESAPRSLIVHPGGPGVLDAVESALGPLEAPGLEPSRQTLRRFGNMSSGTVLFALDEALRRGAPLPATLLAFGPGLTFERITLAPA